MTQKKRPQSHVAVTSRLRRSHFAVINDSKSGLEVFAVTSRLHRSHFAVINDSKSGLEVTSLSLAVHRSTSRSQRTQKAATKSLCGHFAVRRSHFAVINDSKSGLEVTLRHFALRRSCFRGYNAVTLRSQRGHYAVTTVTAVTTRNRIEAEKTLNFAPKRTIWTLLPY